MLSAAKAAKEMEASSLPGPCDVNTVVRAHKITSSAQPTTPGMSEEFVCTSHISLPCL